VDIRVVFLTRLDCCRKRQAYLGQTVATGINIDAFLRKKKRRELSLAMVSQTADDTAEGRGGGAASVSPQVSSTTHCLWSLYCAELPFSLLTLLLCCECSVSFRGLLGWSEA